MDSGQQLGSKKLSLSIKDYKFMERLELLAKESLSRNQISEALSYLSQSLSLRKALYGENSQRFRASVSDIFSKIHPLAVQYLNRGESSACLKVLFSLYTLVSVLGKERSETLNTIACAYKAEENWAEAKKAAKKAIKYGEISKVSKKSLASMHLNLAEIYNDTSKHAKAAQHCKLSIEITQEALLDMHQYTPRDVEFLITHLALSYYTLAKQLEKLKDLKKARKWYEKAILFLKNNAGPSQQSILKECERCYRRIDIKTTEIPLIKRFSSVGKIKRVASKKAINHTTGRKLSSDKQRATPVPRKKQSDAFADTTPMKRNLSFKTRSKRTIPNFAALGERTVTTTESPKSSDEVAVVTKYSVTHKPLLMLEEIYSDRKCPKAHERYVPLNLSGNDTEQLSDKFGRMSSKHSDKISMISCLEEPIYNVEEYDEVQNKSDKDTESVQNLKHPRINVVEERMVKSALLIQSFYRSKAQREKYLLQKKKTWNLVARNCVGSHFISLSKGKCTEITVYSNYQDFRLTTNEDIDIIDIKFTNGKILITKNLIHEELLKISNKNYVLHVYKRDFSLDIMAENTENNSVYILSLDMPEDKLELKNKIIPRLIIEEEELRLIPEYSIEDVKQIHKIQNVFRRRYYREVTYILAQQEVNIEGISHLIIISSNIEEERIQSGEDYTLKIETSSPGTQSMSLSTEEIDQIFLLKDPKDILLHLDMLFLRITISNDQIDLKDKNKLLLYDVFTLNNDFKYTLMFYKIDTDANWTIQIQAIDLQNSLSIENTLTIEKKEVMELLGIEESEIIGKLKELGDLVIVEGDNTLNLSRRYYSSDRINLEISADPLTDESIQKYAKNQSQRKNSSQDSRRSSKLSKRSSKLSKRSSKSSRRSSKMSNRSSKMSKRSSKIGKELTERSHESMEKNKNSSNEASESDSSEDSSDMDSSSKSSGADSDEAILEQKKMINEKEYTVSIYKETYTFYIEIANNKDFFSDRFTFQELNEIHHDPENLFRDLWITEGEITINEPKTKNLLERDSEGNLLISKEIPLEGRILLRLSKKANQILYTIVMYFVGSSISGIRDSDLLQFEVYSNSTDKKTISINLKTASEYAGIPKENVVPIGNYLIHNMLNISDRFIDFNRAYPSLDLNKVATRLQAAFKGHMTRKKLNNTSDQPKAKLIARSRRMMAGKHYRVSAYEIGTFITIEAVCEKEVLDYRVEISEIVYLEEEFTRTQIVENFILPSLYILEQNHRKILCLESSFKLTTDKIMNRLSNEGKKSKNHSEFKLPEKPVLNMTTVNSHTILPTKVDKLIAKTGAFVSNRYVTLAFIEEDFLVIQATGQNNLFLRTNSNKNISDLSLIEKEDFCFKLLPFLSIELIQGELKLVLNHNVCTPELLYKRTHEISERMLSLSVLSNHDGTIVEALDIETNCVYKLVLSSSRTQDSPEFQAQINEVIPKLRLISVFSGLTLTING